MPTSPSSPGIARIWRGRTTRARADEYEAYNYEAGIKPLERERRLGATCYDPDAAEFCRELIKLAGLTSIRLQLFPEQ